MAEPSTAHPVDPDVDLSVPAQREEIRPRESPVLAVIAVGGAIGASARYGAALLWPTASGAFPWTTLLVNSLGCAVIGVFMVLLTEVWAAHRLVRPFFGTGVLGGFTTFSTYATDVGRLVDGGQPRTALAYLALTLAAALASVWVAAALTRRTVRRERAQEAQ
ncbi:MULTISPECIES: fluoride efflux transporter CrcB [unclassified Streptomyces]|uniref:fluoride efflux transporter CrcB n=1 Tax=unclassified Streptomyces TaxID=2593676 RepID=UPI002E2C461F|nr:fluoride efflux transporter CrcB [Streptomyces sp. NBC_00223]